MFLYFVIDVHESLVCPEQFNCLLFFRKKSSSSCTFFGFPASSAYLNHFQNLLYDFEIHIFTVRTTEGLIHNYYEHNCIPEITLEKTWFYFIWQMIQWTKAILYGIYHLPIGKYLFLQ